MQALHDIKGKGPTLGPPKTESAVRTVPVADSIAVRLAAHIEEYVEDVEPGALVFTSLRGGPLLNTYFAPSGRRHGTKSVSATSGSTTSATSPAPRPQRRGPRSERSCRSWAAHRAPPASATSRPPNTEAARSPTPSAGAWRADSPIRLATREFEPPIELLLVSTTYEFPARLLQTVDPPRLVLALPLSESLDEPHDAGRVV